jgi:hypothetical protein
MAGKAAEYHRGDQDIHEQQATFRLVMGITKWGSLTFAALLLFLVLWFCVPSAGFWPGLISAAIVVAIGITVLRSRPESGH